MHGMRAQAGEQGGAGEAAAGPQPPGENAQDQGHLTFSCRRSHDITNHNSSPLNCFLNLWLVLIAAACAGVDRAAVLLPAEQRLGAEPGRVRGRGDRRLPSVHDQPARRDAARAGRPGGAVAERRRVIACGGREAALDRPVCRRSLLCSPHQLICFVSRTGTCGTGIQLARALFDL